MSDLVDRASVLAVIAESATDTEAFDKVKALPPAQPDDRLAKIADLVDGTIDHFDLDDAMDLLYQIKEVLK